MTPERIHDEKPPDPVLSPEEFQDQLGKATQAIIRLGISLNHNLTTPKDRIAITSQTDAILENLHPIIKGWLEKPVDRKIGCRMFYLLTTGSIPEHISSPPKNPKQSLKEKRPSKGEATYRRREKAKKRRPKITWLRSSM